MATSQWRPLENKSMTFSPGKTPLWFRFSVENQASQEHWVLRFVSPLLDRIEFYSSSPQIKPRVAGRSLRFDMRDFPDRTVAFNFSVQPHKRETFYVRIQMEGGRVCAMNILSTHEENQTIARESVIFGIYFGALIIMALYNVLLYFSVRDRSYIIYGVNTLAFLFLQMGITGYGFEYVIPDTPHYFRIWLGLSLSFVPVTMAWFSSEFLSIRTNSPRTFGLIVILCCGHLTLCIYGTFFNWLILTRFGTFSSLAFSAVLILAALDLLRNGYRPARFYLIAWSGLLLGAILWVTGLLGILPQTRLTQNGMQIGSALEVLLLSLALGDRINIMKEEKETAQQQTMERQRILTSSYARFVPSEIMDLLEKKEITEIALGDAIQKEMTVLFSDIRSFTTLSEGMTPKENFEFLNALMRRTGPVIRENGGFIDKFIGDAIMALFPRHAEDALKAAIQMKRNLSIYNTRRASKGFEPLRVGIGINTGLVILGTIGEPERMDGTVISDTVNLASRIEGLTKHYDAALLITEQTLFRLDDPTRYRIRLIERVRVKGKHEPVSIFEVFDGDPE
ncbi:MAG TPA: 7TM diverse intracellular signaling domain-containing protein, partial [Leptospiraceae bacterium]|nr:7TM diverse intracellular signaling domain-containing protein [Leptospiraceae bacterium]